MTEEVVNQRHIAALRTKCGEERERIAALNARLGDSLKQMLRSATAQLNDVETFFLDPKILSESRTPQKLAQWLANAGTFLKIAIDTRKNVEDIADKFGPDAKLI